MKNTSACPKCESADIIRVPGSFTRKFIMPFAAFHNLITLKTWSLKPTNMMVAVTRMVCTECGFSEEWIEDAEDITKLKKNYGPRKKPIQAREPTHPPPAPE